MTRIVQCELSDVVGELPAIEKLDLAGVAKRPPDTLFLCALGFEERCVAIPQALAESGYEAEQAVYFQYATNLDDNAVNRPGLEEYLGACAPRVESLEADDAEFVQRFREFLAGCVGQQDGPLPTVTVDISVMANRLLIRCMDVLMNENICVRVLYSEALLYHPTQEEYLENPEAWSDDGSLGLELGVGAVGQAREHPGEVLEQLPDAVVLFPSFKAERSQAVLSSVDPALLTTPGEKVLWMVGVPHLEEDAWRADAMKKLNRLDSSNVQYEVCTFNYLETLRHLERIHGDLSRTHRITLSPLGSKMQALGTTLFCYMHPDVRVFVSAPKEYNAAQYSRGCKAMWSIDFGCMARMRATLDRVGTLSVEEA